MFSESQKNNAIFITKLSNSKTPNPRSELKKTNHQSPRHPPINAENLNYHVHRPNHAHHNLPLWHQWWLHIPFSFLIKQQRDAQTRGRGTGRGQREGKGVWVIGSKNINKNQQTKFYCFSNWVKTVVKRSKKHSPIFIEHVFISKLHFKTKNRKLTTIMTGALVSHAQLILNSNFDFIVLCILSVIGIPCFNRKITLDIRVTIWGMII